MPPTTPRKLTLAAIILSALSILPATAQTLNEDLKIIPADGEWGAQFGFSIAVSDGVLAVGACLDDDNGQLSGSAYLLDAITGDQIFKLLATDGASSDRFGWSIDIDDGLVVVGAYADDDNGSASGAAYLFNVSTGLQIAKLLPSDGDTNNLFGWSVAIDNGIVAVGARRGDGNGAVYLFDAATGMQMNKLLADDGAEGDEFGYCVAIDHGIVAVGAPFSESNGVRTGSAYLFDASTGQQLFKLLPDTTDSGEFGHSIAMDDGIVAVGGGIATKNGVVTSSVYTYDIATGTQTYTLFPSDEVGRSWFGYSIAINHGIVAVTANENPGGSGSGAAYLFDLSTGEQTAKLLQSEEDGEDAFGSSIAIGTNIIAVGAWGDSINGTNAGAAYIFDILPATPEHLKITPSDGAPNDLFARSIAIDSNILAVGARGDADNGTNSGSAYLFDSSTGDELAKLLPADGASGDQFGISIDINNTTVVVGSWRDDENGSNSGSAYIFDTTTATQSMKLLPTDGSTNDQFGYSVAIDNNIIAVGSILDDDNGSNSGSVYLFDATTGAQLLKLLPADGAANDQFGFSIAIDNDLVAVGAINGGTNSNGSGCAYVFDASTGEQINKLIPTDGAADDKFGYSIAINNGIVAVGANEDDDDGNSSGSAYIFDAVTGTQIAKILPRFGALFDFFGSSIAIDNGIVAIGAHEDDDQGSRAGKVYLYDASTGNLIATLLPTDGAEDDEFGYSIAMDSGVIAVGSWRDDSHGTNSGSAYLFDTNTVAPCPADLTADGELDFFDLSAFITLFSAADLAADFTNDAQLDFFDIAAFIAAYSAGCP